MAKMILNKISGAIQQGDRLKEALARTKLLQILKDEETFRLQQYQIQCLKEGDKKYILFYKVVIAHKTNNHIKDLYNSTGKWVSHCNEIDQVLLDYF